MKHYLKLLADVTVKGDVKSDRTGTGTTSLFGVHFRHDMRWGFPLLTTKKMHTKSIIHELLWFLKGDTNVKYLQDNGVTIWDEWADKDGNLGRVYGAQWRSWACPFVTWKRDGTLKGSGMDSIDQIQALVNGLRINPFSRRHIVTAWNPAEVEGMALPPCHVMFQCNVRRQHEKEIWSESTPQTLDLQMYQRSADLFLGVPFNIASYALLLQMLAQVTGMRPGVLSICFGDLHIYSNHVEQVEEQLRRVPFRLPCMLLNPDRIELDDFTFADFQLVGYESHPAIKAPIAV